MLRLAVCVLVLLALPGAAAAAVVQVRDGAVGDELVVYQASPGEVNSVQLTSVRVTEDADGEIATARVTLVERQAPVRAGPGCVAEDASVTCRVDSVVGFELVKVLLGDGDDVFTAAGQCVDEPWCRLEVDGEAGDDTITGSESTDILSGGNGRDVLDGRAGAELFFHPEADFGDSLYGESGSDTLVGGRGGDYLVGGEGADTLRGGHGFDAVSYQWRSRAVFVDLEGDADDGVRGERDMVAVDVEAIRGGIRADRLVGDARRNSLYGGPGNDTILAGNGPDWLEGGDGSDLLHGGPGADELFGGPVDVFGAAGPESGVARDVLVGASGNDSFFAQDGKRDRLHGGPGRDRARIDCALDRVTGLERVNAKRPTTPLSCGLRGKATPLSGRSKRTTTRSR